jgi:hypothetical protein
MSDEGCGRYIKNVLFCWLSVSEMIQSAGRQGAPSVLAGSFEYHHGTSGNQQFDGIRLLLLFSRILISLVILASIILPSSIVFASCLSNCLGPVVRHSYMCSSHCSKRSLVGDIKHNNCKNGDFGMGFSYSSTHCRGRNS